MEADRPSANRSCVARRPSEHGGFQAAVGAGVLALLAGCGLAAEEAPSSAPAGGEFEGFESEFEAPAPVRDPLRGYNRFMFRVNDRIYFWFFRPVAIGYGKIVPQGARKAVERCATNLEFPVRFVNCGLQGKFRPAAREAGRFGVNTTVGLLGLFDPARSWLHMEPAEEDFGQTLGRYGVGPGWPVVLPLLGQSNVRDAIGLIPDTLLKPTTYVKPPELSAGLWCYREANYVSLHIGSYESLKRDALDPYTMVRDAYSEMRAHRIRE
jgi:phospholipid-binding lipoprotein MlaA